MGNMDYMCDHEIAVLSQTHPYRRPVHVHPGDQLAPGVGCHEQDLEGDGQAQRHLEFSMEGDLLDALRGGPGRYRGDVFLVMKLEVRVEPSQAQFQTI